MIEISAGDWNLGLRIATSKPPCLSSVGDKNGVVKKVKKVLKKSLRQNRVRSWMTLNEFFGLAS